MNVKSSPEPDRANKTQRRRRRWTIPLVLALMVWPVALFWMINTYARHDATRIAWEMAPGVAAPDEFCVLVFPQTTSPSCTAMLTGFNRAALERLEELNGPEVEVFVHNAPAMIDRTCVSYLPGSIGIDAMVDSLNAEIRSWGPSNTDWLGVEVKHRTLSGGWTEIRLTVRQDDRYETYIYETDGAALRPSRWENLSGAGYGVTAASLLLLVLAAHFVLVVVVLLIWSVRRIRRRVIGNRA